MTFVAWQRREALRLGIESCLVQTYPRIEIIVIDNSPTDEIHRWLFETYPQVRSIKTPRPIALPAARNLSVATAAGEFVFFHDDDSRFSTPDDVRRAVDYIRAHPYVACLAFRVGDGRDEWNPQFDGPAPCPTYTFIACAVMFRRADFRDAGWYFEDFWLYGEERVMALGFFGLGKEIHFLPEVSIIHIPESAGRTKDNAARYWLAEVVMTPGSALLKFPFPAVLWLWPAMLAYYTLLTALVRKRPWLAIRALGIALSHVPIFLRRRSPIPQKEFERWRRVRDEYQRAYLQRTGRWRWHHQLFPAVG
ncbi:MAG TPA: glycosyltransferase [Chthoniobacteraceae bacterium]|nr:glycosyltransferase [Chthoniobacteraceae bacterium]